MRELLAAPFKQRGGSQCSDSKSRGKASPHWLILPPPVSQLAPSPDKECGARTLRVKFVGAEATQAREGLGGRPLQSGAAGAVCRREIGIRSRGKRGALGTVHREVQMSRLMVAA